jgi:serine/threonine protein kinase
MDPVRLTCSCGHSWTYTGPGPIPDNVRAVCPVCGRADPLTRTKESPPLGPAKGPVAETTEFTLQPDLGPGTVLGGFVILEEINRGGMGVIYKATQPGVDRVVALKVISPGRLGSPDALKRFKQEVRAAARVNHPNIVQVFSTDLDGPYPFLAMEFVPGIDLAKLVKAAGPLAPADAVNYVLQAAHGLQHAFEEGLVHRDIKPANIMVTPSPLEPRPAAGGRRPRVKLLDMGLARVVADGEVADPGDLTRDGIFLGTPDYVAPEQAEDSRRADIRADLYSLGASLYFLLTGEIPFPGTTVVQKLRKQLTESPPSVLARRPEVGPALDAVVRRLMARSPVERYQTPAELIDALERVLRGAPGAAAPAPRPAGGVAPPAPSDVVPRPGSGTYPTVGSGPSSTTHTPLGVGVAKAHDGGFHGLAVTPDGKHVLTGGLDGFIRVWNPVRMKEVRAFAGDVGAVAQLALAPGGRWLASCGTRLAVSDMRVQIWDVARGVEHGRLRGAGDNYRCVAVSADGRRVAAGAADGSVWVWALEADGPKPLALSGHRGAVNAVVFSRSGNSLLSGGEDGTVRQWEVAAGREKGAFAAGVGSVAALATGRKRLAVAGRNGVVVRQKDGELTPLDGHDGPVTCAAASADGGLWATGGSDGTVRLWDAETGSEVSCLGGPPAAVWAVAFGPDGGVVYAGDSGGSLRRWPVNVTPGG